VTEEELELGDERTTIGSTKKRDGTGPDSTTNPRRRPREEKSEFLLVGLSIVRILLT
jgi:hypothetical protein